MSFYPDANHSYPNLSPSPRHIPESMKNEGIVKKRKKKRIRKEEKHKKKEEKIQGEKPLIAGLQIKRHKMKNSQP